MAAKNMINLILVLTIWCAVDRAEAWPFGATSCPRSGVVTKAPGCTVQERHRGALPLPRSGVAAQRSYPTPKVRGGGGEEQPTSKEWWLRGHKRAQRNYSTFKVRRGGREKTPLSQVKEQRLRFAGAAMKRYPCPR